MRNLPDRDEYAIGTECGFFLVLRIEERCLYLVSFFVETLRGKAMVDFNVRQMDDKEMA